jgi:hypothetical protein
LQDAGGGKGGVDNECARERQGGELLPLDMYVMQDRSGSMQGGRWTGVTSALKQFVQLPNLTDLGMGLAFFPIPTATALPQTCSPAVVCPAGQTCTQIPVFGGICEYCEPTEYAKPIVPIAGLPGVASDIIAAIDGTGPGGGTPMTQALQGAMMYTLNWAAGHPDRITLVVLATDGVPEGCSGNDVASVSAVAAQGFASSPQVLTFVVGIGDLSSLDAIAKAGGTDKAIIISGSNPEQAFLDALNQIRGAVGCTMLVPTPQTGEPNLEEINVVFDPDPPGGGDEKVLDYVTSAADCLGKQAWHFSADQSRIQLCPAACDLVSNQSGTLDVVLGCKRPPPS